MGLGEERNVGLICPSCAEIRKVLCQEDIENRIMNLFMSGKKLYVKFRFRTEHVWVAVSIVNLNGGYAYGRLSNDLVLRDNQKFKIGYPLRVNIREIEEMMTG